MTMASEQGYGRPDPILRVIMSERRQVISVAYRLLGSLADAEDVVQETYARWYAMAPQQQEAIDVPGAWLTKVASRISLDLLKAARARRERYVGEWIPEPLPTDMEWISGPSGGAGGDPAERVTLDESITMAFLVVLETMTPAERVAFVLHDVFSYSSPTSPRSSAAPREHVASWPPLPAAASVPSRLVRLRRPSRPASSATSSRLGRLRTSTPSSGFSTPVPP